MQGIPCQSVDRTWHFHYQDQFRSWSGINIHKPGGMVGKKELTQSDEIDMNREIQQYQKLVLCKMNKPLGRLRTKRGYKLLIPIILIPRKRIYHF